MSVLALPLPTAPAATDELVVLVGTANVGKSALFGALTGRYATVSNYPGTTVDVCSARTTVDGASAVVLDTPGPLRPAAKRRLRPGERFGRC